MTAKNLFVNVFADTNLGYIRIIEIGDDSKATERIANALTASEIAWLMDKEVKAWYNIGEYWHIVL